MRIFTLFIFLLIFAGLAVPAHAFLGLFGKSIESVTAENGLVTLDISKFSNGEARHYVYREGGALIRFFIVKDAQGVVRAALDACDVCWRENKGYKLQNGAMLCVNCGQQFALSRIGEVRGGCNPHPIAFTSEGGSFTITTGELSAGAKYFPEKK